MKRGDLEKSHFSNYIYRYIDDVLDTFQYSVQQKKNNDKKEKKKKSPIFLTNKVM
jgi:hypothetical protein